MVDPIIVAGGSAVAAGFAWVADKVLGPSFALLGEGLRDRIRQRIQNANRIIEIAARQLGPQLERDGQVDARVMERILVDGSLCDDPLAQHYFGGLLATSRTDTGDDDALHFVNLVNSLPTRQLRLHYVFYKTFALMFRGRVVRMEVPFDRPRSQEDLPRYLYLPFDLLSPTLGLDADGSATLTGEVHRCINGLQTHGLLAQDYAVGEDAQKRFSERPGPGAILGPTAPGAELFLWAHGFRLRSDEISRQDLEFSDDTGLVIPDGAREYGGSLERGDSLGYRIQDLEVMVQRGLRR